MARGKPLFAVRISLYTCSGTLFRFGTTLEERARLHPSPPPRKTFVFCWIQRIPRKFLSAWDLEAKYSGIKTYIVFFGVERG